MSTGNLRVPLAPTTPCITINTMKNLLKKPLYLAILSIILLSMPWLINGLWFTILAGFVPLFFIQKNSSQPLKWAAAVFFTWIMITCWWVSLATVLALIMIPLVGLVFTFVPWAIFHKITKNNCSEPVKWLLFISIWICAEAAYTHQDISFPWLTLGNAPSPFFVQWYSSTGIFGGTLWILISNILIFKSFENYSKARAITAASVILTPMVFSTILYINRGGELKEGEKVQVAVIQPNIDPYTEKFKGLNTYKQVQIMLNEAKKAPLTTDYYILPETAISGSLWLHNLSEDISINQFKSFLALRNPSATFVTGASTLRLQDNTEPTNYNTRTTGDFRYISYNTALWVDTTDVIDYYHKAKLVCGVEMIPYPEVFSALDNVFSIDLGGLGGKMGRSTERAIYDDIGTAICYEGIYGEFFTEYVQRGAQLIFIISNDGWWGNTAGHKHLLRYSRLRAIETSRWIARSANTGISAVIDHRGGILHQLTWDKRGVIVAEVYKRDNITPYVQWGDLITRLALFIMGLLLFYQLSQHYRKKIVSL